jgi:outer membrane usher protein
MRLIMPNVFLPLPIALGIINSFPATTHANAEVLPTNLITNENGSELSTSDEYVFDQAFFRGSSLNQKALKRLSEGSEITAGFYKSDLYVNDKFIKNISIEFIETTDLKIKPCFTTSQLKSFGIQTKIDDELEDACGTLEELVGSGTSYFDVSNLRLTLSIPQSLIKQTPRGYVSPSQLDHGTSMAFVNYYTNFYHNNYKNLDQTYQQNSAYLSLNGGFNLGAWQFRQQSSLNYNDSETHWNNLSSYVKRPIPQIQSELSAGQLVSSGRFFSGLSFNGINLSTDDRMLPDSMRGYAPTVQGIAKTTAKVSIFQNGKEIYQTTVAPGAFKISDLYPTSYNGDLNVVVTEADGTMSEFKVPFAAVPESVRQGAFKYNIDIGRTRDLGEDTTFSNITTQYGLNNAFTLNNGLRIADGYQSAMFGTAYTNHIGAFGTELTYSRANVPDEGTVEGWMLGANYSKTFQSTNTTIALAGYRFSTEGYRDLSDVISLRQSKKDQVTFQSSTYKEQSRATLMLNQSFDDLGTLYVSGSASNYRDDKPKDYQLQIGYGKSFSNGMSFNASATHQNSSILNNYTNQNLYYSDVPFTKKAETTFALSLSIPLDKPKNIKNVLLNYNGSSNRNNYQAMVNGDITSFEDLNYTAGISYDDQSKINVLNAGLNKRFDYANTSFNASKGDNYWQASANVQGALAVHSGGITFGPYLGETFALVEAKNAEGASILNAQGTKINKSGYALIPALTPYRYNTIALNPEGMSSQTEIIAGDVKIAPYSGASIKVNFNTRQGHAMLIQSKLASGEAVPLGSNIQNMDGENIGMAGQNGQVYLRASEISGKVSVIWGDESSDRCVINYEIPKDQIGNPLVHLNEICKIEN